MYLLSDQDWNDLERGHYLTQTRINAGRQNAATIQDISWTITEVRPVAFGKTWHHQETISGEIVKCKFMHKPLFATL